MKPTKTTVIIMFWDYYIHGIFNLHSMCHVGVQWLSNNYEIRNIWVIYRLMEINHMKSWNCYEFWQLWHMHQKFRYNLEQSTSYNLLISKVVGCHFDRLRTLSRCNWECTVVEVSVHYYLIIQCGSWSIKDCVIFIIVSINCLIKFWLIFIASTETYLLPQWRAKNHIHPHTCLPTLLFKFSNLCSTEI